MHVVKIPYFAQRSDYGICEEKAFRKVKLPE